MNTTQFFRKNLDRFRMSDPEIYTIILSEKNIDFIRTKVETKIGKKLNSVEYQNISIDYLSYTLDTPTEEYIDLYDAITKINKGWYDVLYKNFNDTEPSIQQFYQRSVERGFLQKPSEIDVPIMTQEEKRIERPDPNFLGAQNPLFQNNRFNEIYKDS